MQRTRRRSSGEHGDLRTLTDDQEAELRGGAGWVYRTLRRRDAEDLTMTLFFDSTAERAEAWRLHGERLLRQYATPLSRPRGWWLYEAGATPPATGRGQAVELILGGHVTGDHLVRAAETLSAEARRVLVSDIRFAHLADHVVRRPFVDDLRDGLTDKGWRKFLGSLPGAVRIEVEAAA